MRSQANNKYIRLMLEIDGEIVFEKLVKMQTKIIEEITKRWYHTYALKQKVYKIFIEFPSKNCQNERNYLTLNLNKLNFKPSNNDTSTEQ